jgi:hypothetical protein
LLKKKVQRLIGSAITQTKPLFESFTKRALEITTFQFFRISSVQDMLDHVIYLKQLHEARMKGPG